MGVDDVMLDIVEDYSYVEALRGMPRDERKNKWQELIRVVEELIRSAVEIQEECNREDNYSNAPP